MDKNNYDRVRRVMDFIYDACRYDHKGEPRPDQERNREYARYIGWLEGNLLQCMTNEQAERFTQRINLGVYSFAADEALLHHDEDSSFF